MPSSQRPPVWFTGALLSGAILALLVLGQTIAGYYYISDGLVRQEARRSADRVVGTLRTTIRIGRVRDATTLSPLLEELRSDTPDRLAWLLVTDAEGRVLASTASRSPETSADGARAFFSDADRLAVLEGGPAAVAMPGETGRPVVSALVACRCLALAPGEGEATLRGRLTLVQIGFPEASVAASFSRLRRTTITNGAAALALLAALALISRRFPAYVRGRQLESQLELARQVQRDLQPPADRTVSAAAFSAVCHPTALVGGDFYDVRATGEDRAAFLLGDVSGHGLSAALVMALAHGALGEIDSAAAPAAREQLMRRLNRMLVEKTGPERFVTLCWCDYDARAGALRYLNAGHVPPWLVRGHGAAAEIERLAEGGPPLGILADARYEEVSVPVSPGDLLIIVSDGITEAPAHDRGDFGDQDLVALVRETADRSPVEIRRAILDAARQRGTGGERDDQTVLVARLQGPATGERRGDLERIA